MTPKFFISAILKFLLGVVLVGALVFIPAGTLRYTGGIIFMCVLFVPMLIAGFIMVAKSPSLLAKRLNVKEKEREQSIVVKLSGLMFIAGFVVAGLDFRFGWIELPFAVNIVATVVFVIAYVLYAEVLRENAYLSRTIEVQENQKVIDTGLYGVVRHPMYLATFLMFLPMPLILGSLSGLIPFALYPVLIVIRILNEDKVLSRELHGYTDYMKKVKYRLIPFIW